MNKQEIHDSKLFVTHYPIDFLRTALALLARKPEHLKVPIVALYYYLAKCLFNQKQAKEEKNLRKKQMYETRELYAYQELKEHLQTYMKMLKDKPTIGLINVFLATQNYLKRKAANQALYFNDYVLLNRKAEKYHLFYKDNVLQPLQYLNTIKSAITMALSYKNRNHPGWETSVYKEIAEYINNNHKKVNNKYSDFVKNIVNTWFYIYNCQYFINSIPQDHSIKTSYNALKSSAKKDNLMITLMYRVLCMQYIYLFDSDLFDKEVGKFRVFLTDHKEEIGSTEKRQQYLNYITTILDFLKIQEKIGVRIKQDQEIKALNMKIDNYCHVLVERDWLKKELQLLSDKNAKI